MVLYIQDIQTHYVYIYIYLIPICTNLESMRKLYTLILFVAQQSQEFQVQNMHLIFFESTSNLFLFLFYLLL